MTDPAKRVTRTLVYDIRANRFRYLKPKRRPTPGYAAGTAYIQGQDAVLAIIGAREPEQWVYSFKKNDWTQLPKQSAGQPKFHFPYVQMDYVAKHGVLVNYGGGTSLMRPDVGKLDWSGVPASAASGKKPGK